MSTNILGENLPLIGSYDSSLFSVSSSNAESLGDYIRRVRTEKGLSTTDVESLSRYGGAKGISDAYVTRIENGYVTNVSPDKLAALAKGLQISEDEVFAVARGSAATGDLALDESRLLHFYRSIPLERRSDALSYLEMLFSRYGSEQPDQKNGKGPKPGAVYEAVAGIPKAISASQKKARKSPRKKSEK